MLQTADSVRLVLWFKGKGDPPIYTYDMRKGKEKKKKKKSQRETKEGRVRDRQKEFEKKKNQENGKMV